MRVLKPLQDKATTGAGKRLVLPEPRRVRFLIRGEGPVSAGAVTIECCPESTKAGKFWMELATIPVPADNGDTCGPTPLQQPLNFPIVEWSGSRGEAFC